MNTVKQNGIACIVGLSGGIDSAVSAYMLKEAGYRVTGVFMHNWQQDQCPDTTALSSARHVASFLGIDFDVVDLSHIYWDKVFSVFLDQLADGLTPNPDLLCNEHVKFRAFKDYFGDDKIFATGHYAQIKQIGDKTSLLRGVDPVKDQTYFLARLGQNQLHNLLFPIGHMEKSHIRAFAQKHNFPNKDAPESMGICFIEQGKLAPFLAQYMLDKPGDIIDLNGHKIGKHNGLFYYTIGQRKGLNIGGRSGFAEKPFYVLSKNINNNTITVTQDIHDDRLLKYEVHCDHLHEIRHAIPISKMLTAKIRHQQTPQECMITHKDGDKVTVRFNEAQRAVAPGQYVVFYDGSECLGSAMVSQ